METDSKLKKSLTTLDLVCLGINGVVGTGIFVLPGIVAIHGGKLAPVLYLICGIFCFSIALCFAEMGGAFSKTGGAYVYAKEAFGPLVGFMVGWEMWIASLIGWASVAASFLFALNHFYPGMTTSLKGMVVVSLLIIFLSVLNYLGAKTGAGISNLFSFAKMLPLLIFVFIGIPHVNISGFLNQSIPGVKSLVAAFFSVLYIYSGFEELPVPASEVKNPQKSVPKAIFIVLSGVTIFYVIIQFILQAGAPVSTFGESTPLAAAAASFMGNNGAFLLALGAVISIAGVNAGIALTGPRSLYVLAEDRFLPPFLAKLHPKFKTPHLAIIVNTTVVLILTLTGTFERLVFLSALASILQYLPTALAVIVLRKKQPDLKRSYRVPGGNIIPILAVVVCLLLLSQAGWQDLVGTLVLLGISIPVYFAFRANRVENED